MNVLVFAPHPDDAAISCGGTIAKLAKKNSVIVVYMTGGGGGSISIAEKKLVKLRKTEAKNAAKILGVKKTIFLGEPDGFLEFNKKTRQKVITIIRKEKPGLIFAPYTNDKHTDHKATAKLVLDSVWKASGPWHMGAGKKPWRTESVLMYETWTPIQEPEHFEDISKVISKKVKAINCFKSQVKDINYAEAVKGLNRFRGVMSGLGTYCECFEVKEG